MMPKFVTTQLMARIAVVIAHTALAADSQVQWTSVEDTRLPVPPAEHPRLYLRAEHVAKLPARLKDPVLQPAVERLRELTRKSPQLRVEWDALQYLVTRRRETGPGRHRGRAAAYFRNANWPTGRTPAVRRGA